MVDTFSSVVFHSQPDILENVIDHLRGDDSSLKRCSLVSRSFHPPSHRNLFFFIDLNITKKIDQLRTLLITSPDIRQYIRQLSVTIRITAPLDVDIEGQVIASLADVCGMLPVLKDLMWKTSLLLSWDAFSSELQSALVNLFRSPTLTTLRIGELEKFPLSVFHNTSSIKKLELLFVVLGDNSREPAVLPHLEVLNIQTCGPTPSGSPRYQIVTPNLRCLCFLDYDDLDSSTLAQQAVNSAANSLERIYWTYDLSNSNHTLSLKGLQCLQFLRFMVQYTTAEEWEEGFKIVDILKDTSLAHSLKELTISFSTPDVRHRGDDVAWKDVYRLKTWKNLDPVLSLMPALRQVTIQFGTRSYISKQFWDGMLAAMPSLAARGILNLVEGEFYNMEEEMWSSAGYIYFEE